MIFGLPMPPRSSWVLFWFLLTGLTALFRFLLRDALVYVSKPLGRSQSRVLIYGAGSAGSQLAASIRLSGSHQIVAFVDDLPSLWNRDINSIPIFPPSRIASFSNEIDLILLAIPSIGKSRLRQITAQMQSLGLPILQVPSIEELTKGQKSIDSLRPIQIEQLLGRDPVAARDSFLGPGVSGRSVCVTGAGGSIGSELCRNILALDPARLLLIENSEPSLYSIYHKLTEAYPSAVIIPILDDLSDCARLESIFISSCIQTVFHAAAYKHVPLVEANPLAGIRNNIFSTYNLCKASIASSVCKVVLVSSDKAVRPTNVMGATKRVAEMIFQSCAVQQSSISPGSSASEFPSFCMVRFGNVIGSSGSVVPLFTRQIACGGPVTVTHPDITRFFMTITEASQLVLQASALASSGDLLLLDMGEPVLIADLAKQMISLSGHFVKHDALEPYGIEITYTGLRPGEKLYEELLIDSESLPTAHPLIFRARESFVSPDIFTIHLDCLRKSVDAGDLKKSLEILQEIVPEWSKTSSYSTKD